MTLTTAFQELITANPEWHKSTSIREEDSKMFADAFTESGAGELEVRKILISAGYFITESWSKHLGPEIEQDVPKQGIVVGDPKKT